MERDMKTRRAFGRFWYRFPNGESGADVYLRVTLFLGTMFRPPNLSLLAAVAQVVHSSMCMQVVLDISEVDGQLQQAQV